MADRQLLALGQVAGHFAEKAIDYWLFGGWAVDFFVGRVTRRHGDIDFAVWARDGEAIKALMTCDGWTHAPASGEDGGTGYTRDGIRLELTYLLPGPSGAVLIAFDGRAVLWSGSPFGEEVRELNGVTARVIPLNVLRRGKSEPREDPDEAAIDRADHRALERLTDRPLR